MQSFIYPPINSVKNKLRILGRATQRVELCKNLFESFLVKYCCWTLLLECSVKSLDLLLGKLGVLGHLLHTDWLVPRRLQKFHELLIGAVEVVFLLENVIEEPVQAAEIIWSLWWGNAGLCSVLFHLEAEMTERSCAVCRSVRKQTAREQNNDIWTRVSLLSW